MNIKIITSFFKRYWPLGLIILWAAGCWAFFQFCYPYHFFYKEQNQIFLWTADYLQSYNGPGWLARLTGDFFTQFYYYIFAGAAILTAILLLLGDIIRRIFQNLGCGKWAYLVGIAAMTIEAWRHFYYDYSLSSTFSLIGYAFILWLCSTVFISALPWLTFCCLQGQQFFCGTKKKDRLFSLCCAELFLLREA